MVASGQWLVADGGWGSTPLRSAHPERSRRGRWSLVTGHWYSLGWIVLVALALGMRLWELGGRAFHYDEAIHVHYSWRLLNSDGLAGGFPWLFGADFIHSPWMHGPFQIELTAFIFRLFGDSDFTARLAYVLFGAALVGLPYFLRDHLGRSGALAAGVMLALSPAMLYFSRFGRNDILMAFWATALLVLMWRYFHEGKNRYLYLAAVVLAFMFGTKETAYIVTLIFGAIAFLLALPQLIPLVLGRARLCEMAGPAAFFLLLLTLTLPQWVALVSLAQDALGLTLANRDGVASGLVGAPHWAGPSVALPLPVNWGYEVPAWLHGMVALAVVSGLGWLASGRGLTINLLAVGWGAPLLAGAAAVIAILRPFGGAWESDAALVIDFLLAAALAGAAIGVLRAARHPWRSGFFLLAAPAQLALLYCFFLTNAVNVDAMVQGVLPTGISVDTSSPVQNGNAVPVNYLVAGGLLLAGLNLSAYLGVRWWGGRWLLLAGIFYLAWVTVYTTVFTNISGIFSGVWQGMGYWIAQQDVARGNQPWYYYFVGVSIYEALPLVFGIVGAVYFWRRADVFGLVLVFWAALTFIAYTVASEKMPWLLVNITLPLILLAAKYLGEQIERISWGEFIRRGQGVLLLFPAITVAAAVYLLYVYADPRTDFAGPQWALAFSTALLAATSAYLLRLAGPRNGAPLVALGLAGLLLGFGVVTAVRAAYTYDDSNAEMLVYAQGSKDVPATYHVIEEQILNHTPSPKAVDSEAGNKEAVKRGAVKADYEIWYPFNWYARNAQRMGAWSFTCFKTEDEEGWNSGCSPVAEGDEAQALLLNTAHGERDEAALAEYQRDGPLRNLLWFHEEAYRRPGENRQHEGSLWGIRGLPGKEQLTKDFSYFKSVASSRQSWFDALDYLLYRRLDADWYSSQYYSYRAP